MESDGAFQGISHVCTICGVDRQQPAHLCVDNAQFGCCGHRWVGTLASFQFELEYQKGTDNRAADVLSRVPINHSQQTIQSLLEGVIVGASDRGEAEANEGLLEEHECLSQEA